MKGGGSHENVVFEKTEGDTDIYIFKTDETGGNENVKT